MTIIVTLSSLFLRAGGSTASARWLSHFISPDQDRNGSASHHSMAFPLRTNESGPERNCDNERAAIYDNRL